MKIKIIDSSTKKPLLNTKVQLQIKGTDSGFVTLTTDATGTLQLDEKYNGQQISSPFAGGQGPWVTATEGAVLLLPSKQTASSTTTK
jgi:hypothetical protein